MADLSEHFWPLVLAVGDGVPREALERMPCFQAFSWAVENDEPLVVDRAAVLRAPRASGTDEYHDVESLFRGSRALMEAHGDGAMVARLDMCTRRMRTFVGAQGVAEGLGGLSLERDDAGC
jgi:hypothetical protein